MNAEARPVCLTKQQAIHAAAALAFKADTLRRWDAEARERGEAAERGDYADRLDAVIADIQRQIDAAEGR